MIDAQVEGEMATLKETINDMVLKLRIFSSEVTRVSLEVGTYGQLGGQAVVLGVEGYVILVRFGQAIRLPF